MQSRNKSDDNVYLGLKHQQKIPTFLCGILFLLKSYHDLWQHLALSDVPTVLTKMTNHYIYEVYYILILLFFSPQQGNELYQYNNIAIGIFHTKPTFIYGQWPSFSTSVDGQANLFCGRLKRYINFCLNKRKHDVRYGHFTSHKCQVSFPNKRKLIQLYQFTNYDIRFSKDRFSMLYIHQILNLL